MLMVYNFEFLKPDILSPHAGGSLFSYLINYLYYFEAYLIYTFYDQKLDQIFQYTNLKKIIQH